MKDEVILISRSREQTIALGNKLGLLLIAGDLVCLFGELGTGKTCMAKGLLQGAGVEGVTVTSPSFIMVNQYMGRFPIYHADLYRLSSAAEVEEIGFRDCLSDECAVLVEWASRIEGELPEDRMNITLSHLSPTVREIKITLGGHRYTPRAPDIFAAITHLSASTIL